MHNCPPSPFLQSSLHSKCQSGVVALVHVVSSIGVTLEIVVNFDVVRSVVRSDVVGDDGGSAVVVVIDSDASADGVKTSDVDGTF